MAYSVEETSFGPKVLTLLDDLLESPDVHIRR